TFALYQKQKALGRFLHPRACSLVSFAVAPRLSLERRPIVLESFQSAIPPASRLRPTTVPGWSSQLLLGIHLSLKTWGLSYPADHFASIFLRNVPLLSYYEGHAKSH